jgi:hypothetical protein
MKVYIYVDKSAVVLLSGLMATEKLPNIEGIKVWYKNSPHPNMVMVSLHIDEFVYLQDLGVLLMEELLIN